MKPVVARFPVPGLPMHSGIRRGFGVVSLVIVGTVLAASCVDVPHDEDKQELSRHATLCSARTGARWHRVPSVANEKQDSRLVVELRHKSECATLVVDTGSSATLLDQALVERWSLPKSRRTGVLTGVAGSRVVAHEHVLEAAQLGPLQLSPLHVIAIDRTATAALEVSQGRTRTDGVLGRDALRTLDTVVDLADNALWIRIDAMSDHIER